MATDRFKGVTNIGDAEFSEVLRDNLIGYVDWGMIQAGGYINISIPTTTEYGGGPHRLRPVSDPSYTDGQVWEAYRQNWVWESGLAPATPPISISGVFVDTVFNSSGYTVDYPQGRIVFDTAISTASNVQVEYSFKWVRVMDARSIPWFNRAQRRSFRVDDTNYLPNSGGWVETASTRVQLPVVAVEAVVNSERLPYELGNRAQETTVTSVFHILAEDDSTAKRLASILDRQQDQTIFMFDTNRMARENRFPLNVDGSVAPSALTYPDLVAPTGDGGFRYSNHAMWGKLRIAESSMTDEQEISSELYHAAVRWDTEVILLN